MELQKKDLQILEDSLDSKIAFHESEIEEIKNLDDSYYEEKVKRLAPINKIASRSSLTVEGLRNKDIQKERDEIKKVKELKEKLFLSDSYLLLISNKVNLNISK